MSGSSSGKHGSGSDGGLVASAIDFFKQNPFVLAALVVLGFGFLLVSNGTIKSAKKISDGPARASSSMQASNIPAGKGMSSGHTSAGKVKHRPSATPAMVKLGGQLFKQNCEVCHQADAIGKPGVAPSLINQELLSISSDKFLEGTIRDGREDTGMAPFAHLGRSKVQAIVEYLRSHQTLPDRSAEVDNQPDAHGDPRLGQQWYNNIRSTCHGVAGDGYMAGGTGTAIGLKGFLNKATDGFLRETIKYGRSNTRMLGFQGPTAMANLSDQEIDDIIVYLRKQAK